MRKLKQPFAWQSMCFANFRQISPHLPLCSSSSVSAVDERRTSHGGRRQHPAADATRDPSLSARDRGSLPVVLSYLGRRETYVLPKEKMRYAMTGSSCLLSCAGSDRVRTGMPVSLVTHLSCPCCKKHIQSFIST